MKPFPTIWYRGHEAGFYLGEHLVRVPLKFGSKNGAEHVIPWLYRSWPFHIETGTKIRPQLIKKIDGKKVSLHRLYAGLLGHDGIIDAVDGDLLHWTVENIGPRRKPEKIVPQASQDSEVKKQMLERKGEGSIQFYIRQHAKLLGTLDGVLTTEQLIEAKTKSVLEAQRWERELAARRTRGDADADRQEAKEDQTHPDYENLTPEPDTKLIAKRAMTSSSWDESNDSADNFEALVPKAIIDNTPFEKFRASLNPDRHAPGTEAVLNRHGWKTPANNHHPDYIGKANGSGSAIR